MPSKEVLFKYHSSSSSKKINKDGSLSLVFKVTLQDERHEDRKIEKATAKSTMMR